MNQVKSSQDYSFQFLFKPALFSVVNLGLVWFGWIGSPEDN